MSRDLELLLHDAQMYICLVLFQARTPLSTWERYPPLQLLGCSSFSRQPIEGGRESARRARKTSVHKEGSSIRQLMRANVKDQTLYLERTTLHKYSFDHLTEILRYFIFPVFWYEWLNGHKCIGPEYRMNDVCFSLRFSIFFTSSIEDSILFFWPE